MNQPPAQSGRSHVVVGVDGSDHSMRAVDRAADEADRWGCDLEVLCAGGSPRIAPGPVTAADIEYVLTSAQEVADAAAQRARDRVPGLRAVPRALAEPAAAALVRASGNARLTVLGTRGHGGFAGLLLGSVSLRLAAHCQGPLMIVRGDEPDPEAELLPPLVALKAESDAAAVRFGFEEAQRRRSELRVLYAWSHPLVPAIALRLPPRTTAQDHEAAAALVREAVEPLRGDYPDVPVTERELLSDSPAPALIEASRGAGVIVLGVHRGHRRLALQLGPVAHAILHHAHCPVVVVPSA
ncbi:universal stress protein [Streptomyces sp. AJS327]|nr:universal stress protein [Streptomyces sp. AJS327]